MLNNGYITDKFVEDFAHELLTDFPNNAIRYFKEAGALGSFYDTFDDALAAMDIHTMKDAYKLAMRNPSEVDPEAKLFKVEDDILVSGDSLMDFQNYDTLEYSVVNNVYNEFFGENHWALKKYASCVRIDNENFKGYLCSVEAMRSGAIRAIIKMLESPCDDVNDEDDVRDLLEELGVIIIKMENEL